MKKFNFVIRKLLIVLKNEKKIFFVKNWYTLLQGHKKKARSMFRDPKFEQCSVQPMITFDLCSYLLTRVV